MNNKKLISLTAWLVLATVLGTSDAILADVASETAAKAERRFQKANELRKVADHDAAIAEYEKVIELSPKSKIAQDAQYWIGQSHFQLGRLDTALSDFQGLIDAYPTSAIAPRARQMIERVQQAKEDNSLFEAVEEGDVDQVKLLISKGADVKLRDEKYRTLLHRAAQQGHADITALLIKEGAEINARDNGGWTPLHFAARGGHVHVVELLIAAGAQIDVHSTSGFTPLRRAVDGDQIDVVKLLMSKGADIEAVDNWNVTPLFSAVHNNYIELIKLLLERGVNVETMVKQDRETPLHRAAQKDYLEAAKLLLEAGAYIDSRDMLDFTPLQRAVMQGHQDMVDLLLDRGAIPYRRWMGQDLVGIAMGRKQVEMVKFLINKGFPHSPVHVAAFLGDIDEVKSYLAGGGDISVYDPSWLTLLICATEGVRTEVVDFLINKGADVNQIGAYGLTALQIAAEAGDTEIARLLLNNGADVSIGRLGSPLGRAADNAHKDIVEMLIAAGADVNGNKDELNVRPPWPPDYKFDRGWTTLHNACYHTNRWENREIYQAVVEMLVAHGADVNAKTRNGRTPMSLLKLSEDHSHNEKLIELLKKHGAKE